MKIDIDESTAEALEFNILGWCMIVLLLVLDRLRIVEVSIIN